MQYFLDSKNERGNGTFMSGKTIREYRERMRLSREGLIAKMISVWEKSDGDKGFKNFSFTLGHLYFVEHEKRPVTPRLMAAIKKLKGK